MKKTEIVTIEKLVFGGQGLVRLENGQVVFVWNALPGEKVEIEFLKRKKDHAQAAAVKILEASKHRVEPQDPHFLSSSPWQMMTWEEENKCKQDIAKETYSKIGDLILQPGEPHIEYDTDAQYEYRNKMEFSFAEKEDGTVSLALFQRGKHYRIPIEKASIAHPAITKTAEYLLAWIQKQDIPIRSLKSLIIRSSDSSNTTIAGLFIKDRLQFDSLPALNDSLKGFDIYYSTHKSPASVITDTLYQSGQNYLEETILGTTLRFGLESFFQINVPMFTKALKDIAAFLDPKAPLVDYYAGVGAIGLPLSQARKKTILVESNKQATDFAKHNIKNNNLSGCEAYCMPAENMTEWITPDTQIILDPPRAGLHQDVVQALRTAQPSKIIYLSCNISTQARDMRLLAEFYKPVFVRLYNFFPRTPHIEGLVVLEKISSTN